MVQGKINRGRHTDHPAGRHSIRTNQCPPLPSPHFLQAGCPSCRPTNSVKAPKATSAHIILNIHFPGEFQLACWHPDSLPPHVPKRNLQDNCTWFLQGGRSSCPANRVKVPKRTVFRWCDKNYSGQHTRIRENFFGSSYVNKHLLSLLLVIAIILIWMPLCCQLAISFHYLLLLCSPVTECKLLHTLHKTATSNR